MHAVIMYVLLFSETKSMCMYVDLLVLAVSEGEADVVYNHSETVNVPCTQSIGRACRTVVLCM